MSPGSSDPGGRDVLLAAARARHAAGAPGEAVALLRQTLDNRPDDAEALGLLGVALDGAGDAAAGERALAQALALQETARSRSNRAMVLCHLGRHAEAETEARRALALRPEYPEALNNLGVALDALRRFGEAEDAFRRALALRAGDAAAWLNLGNTLKALGRVDDAADAYERALALDPAPPPPAGPVLRDPGRAEDAVAAFRAAAAARPDSPDALSDVAAALCEHRPDAHNRRGQLLGQLARFDEAVAACERALAIQPDHVAALSNLGNALRALGRLDEAERAERRAVALKPADPVLLNNLAITLQAQDRPDQALALLDLAGELDPDDPETHHHRAMLLLRGGRYAEGWHHYEWRLRIRQAGGSHAPWADKQAWRGEPLAGRTLLVVPEQGLGDTIQFARYVALAAARGGRVVLGVQKPLARLMRGLAGPASVVAAGEPVPAHDLHVPLLSLPGVMGTEADTIPAAVPYLPVEPELAARWTRRVAATGPGLKVGVAWAGNPSHPDDRQRSLPFAALAPLWAVPGVRWFSLQVGARAGDLRDAETLPPEGLIDLSPDVAEFADYAAAVAALDLVITVDTVTAHLAGALARPVWLLLSRTPDWRWLRAGHASPWYPTMRLFRQGPDGTWPPVLAIVAEALRARAAPAPRHGPSAPSRDVLFGWGVADEPGWGALGLQLLRGWAGRDDLRPYALAPPGAAGAAALPALDRLALAPALARSAAFARDLAGAAGRRAATSRLVLHALGDDLRREPIAHCVELAGAPTLAMAGFARTDPGPDALEALGRIPLVIAPSQWAAALLRGWGAREVALLAPTVDGALFHPGSRRDDFAGHFVVFSGGRVGWRGGHDLVLRAFARFARRHPEALLVTVWSPPAAEAEWALDLVPPDLVPPATTSAGAFDAAGWCEANGVARHHLRALGPMADAALATVLRLADCALFPDRADSGLDPLALRAMACGVPTVLSANTSHLDLLDGGMALTRQNGIAGAAYRGWGEGDVDEIVEALERLRADRTAAARLGRTGIGFAATRPWRARADGLADLLRPHLRQSVVA